MDLKSHPCGEIEQLTKSLIEDGFWIGDESPKTRDPRKEDPKTKKRIAQVKGKWRKIRAALRAAEFHEINNLLTQGEFDIHTCILCLLVKKSL